MDSVLELCLSGYSQTDTNDRDNRRFRSNTAHTYADRFSVVEEEPPVPQPTIRSARTMSSNHLSESPRREIHDSDLDNRRPGVNRTMTFEGPTQLRDMSPIGVSRMSRVPSENINMRAQRSQLRPLNRVMSGPDGVGDLDEPAFNGGQDKLYDFGSQRSASPATSIGSAPSRSASYSTLSTSLPSSKKQPPPPPPSRSKKPPPPPPPPLKRSALSTNNVSYA